MSPGPDQRQLANLRGLIHGSAQTAENSHRRAFGGGIFATGINRLQRHVQAKWRAVRPYLPLRWHRDRIGLHIDFRVTWRFAFGLVFHRAMWAGSLHCFRRVIWVRPINYAAIASMTHPPATQQGESA